MSPAPHLRRASAGLVVALSALSWGACGDDASRAPAPDAPDTGTSAPPGDAAPTSATTGGAPAPPADAGGVGDAAMPTACRVSGLPVFPGAEGAGTDTPAGRGGQVVEVTTLADAGPGSLREALTSPFPRTVVFRVGGTIALTEELQVTEPYVTVAGQTAPGDGILIRDAGLVVLTHDVLIQHLRIRPGDSGPVNPETNDALSVLGPEQPGQDRGHHVVLDHVSVSWSEDELLSTWYGASHITVSRSIVGEALDMGRHPKGTHSAGLLVGDGSDCVTLHRNYLVSNDFRNPLISGGGTHDFRNNVVYNWGVLPAEVDDHGSSTFLNFVGNHYQPGPANPLDEGDETELRINMGPDNGMPRIYLSDNHMPGLTAAIARVRAMGMELPMLVDAPFETPPVTTTAVERLVQEVLDDAGALPGRRDAVDARLVADYAATTGAIIDSPADVGGFPALSGGTPLDDADHDGMPDAHELASGLDPSDGSDGAQDDDGDGYTNLEAYLHGL